MQTTDLDVIRAGFERFNGGDAEGLLELTAEDAEIFVQEDLPNGGRWEGRDGFRRMMAEWMEAWDRFVAEPVGFEVGERHVLVRVLQRIKAGELELEEEFFYVMGVSGERLTFWHLYNDEARARRVAGLDG